MRIALLQTGKTTVKYIGEGVEAYASRIRKYTGFEIITIPDMKNTRSMSPNEVMKREGVRICEAVAKNDYVALLDERGKEFRTGEFAGWLEKQSSVPRRILFVIGGPWGFSGDVYARADIMLSLSRMTFPHQLVRLLFAEQLYRAFTIIKGEPYHHE